MTRRLGAKNAALRDQIVAVLRDADGFPLSTGDIAKSLGERLVTFRHGTPPLRPRPPCWSEGVVDMGGQAHCSQCHRFHQEPVWRRYDAQDIRSLLNGLAKRGEVEKVVLDSQRNHYWRRDDSDCDVTA